MSPARWPRPNPANERLLLVDGPRGSIDERVAGELPSALRAGDLLVVNDAATLPASLAGTLAGRPIEARLTAAPDAGRALALLFGAGDWRTPTEARPLADRVFAGETLRFGDDLSATIEAVHARGRLVTLRFDRTDAALWSAIYAQGRPIQYAYLSGGLSLWHVQNRYAGRPWAVEMPSAGHVLTWEVLSALVARGVRLATLTHGAGLSSTGDAELDRLLPLPERYDLPPATIEAVRATTGRVIAVGTSVVRALEGNARDHGGVIVAGEGVTDLRIDRNFRPRIVSGLLTGMHELGASHRDLLAAFASAELLGRAYDHAERAGFLGHEFGDVSLVLAA